jgi:dephospho-CoA kinase
MKTAITGGIGSGKSYVCQLLEQQGIRIYDCDSAAKRLMRTSPMLRQQLCQLIGPETYDEENQLDKAVVARFLLQSEANARAIDDIVHPAVAADFLSSDYQWMECAILFESGFDKLVDNVIVVTAPQELRLQRIMQRDGITRDKALEWIGRQWPQDQVVARSQYEIINDGRPLRPQINDIITNILKV